MYAIGAYIIYQLGFIWLAPYLVYIFWLEIRLLKKSCTNCYYYGKTCGFGKGKLSAILFKKGNAETFIQRRITWKDILPEFLVSLVPLIVGIGLLVIHFDFLILALIVLLVALTTAGNAFVRGNLVCNHCKQREIGCPAQELFNQNKRQPNTK